MTNTVTEALFAAARGWQVIPLHVVNGQQCGCGVPCTSPGKHPIGPLVPHGLKDATCDPATITAWGQRVPDANLGIVTGAESGIVVLDVDPKNGGSDSLADLEVLMGRLPHTVEAITGSGGRHVYFRYPATVEIRNSAGKVGAGLDIRGDGGYVVAPPSKHISGSCYQWEISSEPADTPLADMPAWLLDLVAEPKARANGHAAASSIPSGLPVARQALDFVANGAPVGQQRERAVKATRSYLGAKYSVEDTAKAIWRGFQACDQGEPSQPWTYQDALDIAQDLASKPAPAPSPLQKHTSNSAGSAPNVPAGNSSNLTPLDSPIRLTDTGNAEAFAHLYGHMMRYDHSRSRWLRWCEHWWIEDSDAEVRRLAEQAARKLCAMAGTLDDDEKKKKLFGWAIKSLHRGGLDATISLAQAQRPIADKGDSWDLDPWLLGVNNGVVDLRTGVLRDGRQEDRITKHADVSFDPDAECPLWLAFLDRIMAGNQHLIQFLQRAVGYSLTGIVSERVLFILHGMGANGKSTLLDAIRALLGSYALRTPTETLMMKQNTGIPNDIARLKGARFVFASETEGGKRLAEALIKDMTGNDVISARFMRAEFFDFKPEFKIWMGTNHKPEIRGTDNGIWDRLKLIPFAVRIPENERDLHLPEKLIAELPGILQWAIKGCLDWQENGLGVPDEVKKATAGYREEQDALAGFIGEHCIIKPGVKVGVAVLYKAYSSWCEDSNEKPETQKSMTTRLKERAFEQKRSGHSGSREWYGIGLIDHNSSTDGLTGTDVLSGLYPHEDTTAQLYRENASQPVNPSVNGTEQQISMDEPPIITVPTMQKTVDRSKMQQALDAGESWRGDVDAATIYDQEPDYLYGDDGEVE